MKKYQSINQSVSQLNEGKLIFTLGEGGKSIVLAPVVSHSMP